MLSCAAAKVARFMSRFHDAMAFASLATCLTFTMNSIVALRINSSPAAFPTTHVTTHVSSSRTSNVCTFRPSQTSRSHRALLMAAGGKKRRKRKKGSDDSESPGASLASGAAVPGLSQDDVSKAGNGDGEPEFQSAMELGEVLEGERGLEALFTEDWSDMPANDGMVKTQVPLPDISTFKPTNRAATSMEQREKGATPGAVRGDDGDDNVIPTSLSDFKSKLPPIVDREEERLALSAAERFDEGPIVKGLKTATWFSICTLVAWEVYINSPLFQPQAPPPIT